MADRLQNMVLLGGNYKGVGNATAQMGAEFNFSYDPDSAAKCFKEIADITMVPLEVCNEFMDMDLSVVESPFRQTSPLGNYIRHVFEA